MKSKNQKRRRVGGQKVLSGDHLARAMRVAGLTGGGDIETRPDWILRHRPGAVVYNIPGGGSE